MPERALSVLSVLCGFPAAGKASLLNQILDDQAPGQQDHAAWRPCIEVGL